MPAEDDLVSLVGEDSIVALAAGFYRRVATDDLLGAMYPANDLPAAEKRLAMFLVQRFGGPSNYSAERGHPRLRMRHAPFYIDCAARDRWIALMSDAIREQNWPDQITRPLQKYFDDTATFMINQP